MSTDIRSDFS
ncbi:hypothetical protein Prudu_009357 [Prunus dulcis]|uniref:Uncharacterized protein n=1 Tax=Prunus dulcis TaxID=3755 RepID=A0A4Y1R663_PRUDU|nr:hypothetical protein Prudu_009357 [Prunus dulcis]